MKGAATDSRLEGFWFLKGAGNHTARGLALLEVRRNFKNTISDHLLTKTHRSSPSPGDDVNCGNPEFNERWRNGERATSETLSSCWLGQKRRTSGFSELSRFQRRRRYTRLGKFGLLVDLRSAAVVQLHDQGSARWAWHRLLARHDREEKLDRTRGSSCKTSQQRTLRRAVFEDSPRQVSRSQDVVRILLLKSTLQKPVQPNLDIFFL